MRLAMCTASQRFPAGEYHPRRLSFFGIFLRGSTFARKIDPSQAKRTTPRGLIWCSEQLKRMRACGPGRLRVTTSEWGMLHTYDLCEGLACKWSEQGNSGGSISH
mmetsp:Transcript_70571/g.153875  ORF Transcript_70571/g.153875 Transcript_70571/m.153875 type:complete len:105 (+) Transcript_70571:246-560(+)